MPSALGLVITTIMAIKSRNWKSSKSFVLTVRQDSFALLIYAASAAADAATAKGGLKINGVPVDPKKNCNVKRSCLKIKCFSGFPCRFYNIVRGIFFLSVGESWESENVLNRTNSK